MSNPDKALLFCRPALAAIAGPVPRRINVAVNPTMMSAIDRLIDNEQVTLTEAVRRLIAYGDLVYELAKVRRARLIVRRARGDDQEIVLR